MHFDNLQSCQGNVLWKKRIPFLNMEGGQLCSGAASLHRAQCIEYVEGIMLKAKYPAKASFI